MQMRVILVLVLTLSIFSNLVAQDRVAKPTTIDAIDRTEIALFRYRGAISGGESGAQFDAFRGLIEHKLENLRTKLAQDLYRQEIDAQLKYMDKIHVRLIESDQFQGRSQVFTWMRSENTVQQTLRGSILKTPQGIFRISTRSHLIDSSIQNGERVFSIDLALTADEYANTKDSHSLVLLYGMAIEARRTKTSKSEIKAIAAIALNMIKDVEGRDGKLGLIKQAWQELIDDL